MLGRPTSKTRSIWSFIFLKGEISTRTSLRNTSPNFLIAFELKEVKTLDSLEITIL